MAAGKLIFMLPAFVYCLWLFYLAVMNLKRAKDEGRLSKVAHAFGMPILFAGYLLDFFCNMVPFTIFMLDLPKETTVTARMKRYVKGQAGWRKSFAVWFADNLLDDFDPSGKHI